MPAGQRGHLGPRVQTARVRADWHRADRLRVSLADERERQGRRTVTVEIKTGAGALWHDSGGVRSLPSMTAMI
jgi:hypothetical protein